MLLGRVELREPQAVAGLRGLVYGADGGPVEVHERRPDVENSCLEQRFAWRQRQLVIDEMRDAGRPGARHERLTQRLNRPGFVGREDAKRRRLRVRGARGQEGVNPTNRDRQRASSRALHELSPLQLVVHASSCPFPPFLPLPSPFPPFPPLPPFPQAAEG